MAQSATKGSHDDHHITPISTFVKTALALGVLMGLTILVYSIDFGHHISEALHLGSAAGSLINNAIALTIACIKATLVVLYFMGVKYNTQLTKLWAATGFVWVTLMGITFGDYMTRSWEDHTGWIKGDTEHSAPASFRRLEPQPKHEEEKH